MKPKVMVVDDEKFVRMVICDLLAACGCQAESVEDGIQALELLDNFAPDIIFTDLNMPRMSGLELIAKLKEKLPEIPIVAISGTVDIQSAIEAIRLGAWEYVIKPIDAGSLQHVTKRVLERSRLLSENRAYHDRLESLVSERTRALRDSEIRYRTLFDKANDAIVLMKSGRIRTCNTKTGQLLGIPQINVVGHTLLHFSPARQSRDIDSAEMLKLYEQGALDGTPQFFEWRCVKPDGSIFDAEISLTRLELNGSAHLLAIMRDITDRKKAAVALTENACIKRELDMAREIQRSLLPGAPPHLPGLDLACLCLPAASVGGDYYDFFTSTDGVLDIVIADVAGHSFGSALLMSEARTVLLAKVRADRSPATLLSAVNDLMYDDLCRAELQMSLFAVRFDIRNSMLSYGNAGHTLPILIRGASGTVEQLDADGLLLGVIREVEFEEKSCRVSYGDVLLLHTDGLVESENESGDFFGTERLCSLLVSHRHETADVILKAILDELKSFVGEGSPTDDVSLVLIKISGG